MMRKIQITVFSVLIALVFTCCKPDRPVYQPVGASQIHIGALLSLTGSGMSTGRATQVSLEMARLDIQDYLTSLGIHKTVTLDVADTRTDTTEALKQLKLMYDKGVRLVIGPYSSAEVAALKNFADTHGMLVVSPSSVAVSLAIPGDNIFRFVSSDVIQGEAMSKMLTDDKIKVIVPLVRDDLWGNDLMEVVRRDFVKAGGIVQTPLKYTPGTTVFSGLLSRMDSTVAAVLDHQNPNEVAVYLLSFGEGTAILGMARKYEHLNNVYWYGGSAFAGNTSVMADTNATLFAYTHGLPCPVYGLDDAAKDKWQSLKNRIQSQLGRPPEVYAYTAYDALWVGVLTYTSTGPSPGIELMKSAFVNVAANFFGASGNTLLDENGDRASGNYDFWAVKHDTSGYNWKRVAKYNSSTGTLTRIAE